jgi:predicted DNA-binding ArsR family transcriptional regulator
VYQTVHLHCIPAEECTALSAHGITSLDLDGEIGQLSSRARLQLAAVKVQQQWRDSTKGSNPNVNRFGENLKSTQVLFVVIVLRK